MPLEKRSFMGGMNKDGDVRLIKNPDYIDALNVRVATSVDGTIGSLENIEGNVEVPFEFYSTDPETFFINDNGLYEEINPATVFYQKVIRVQGWEQTNAAYNFSLFSVSPNGNILVGEFNWNGNTGHTFTSFYLNSQFGGTGPYNSGINVYDVNTGDQFTASVKLLSFSQNAMLNGGYFDIVIECDTPGVNFNLSVSSNAESDSFIYTYDEEQTGIPITSSKNLSIFLLPGFESGGVFNTDANDDGVVVSPDGTLYEVGNRTVWRISFVAGEEPTSPTSFDEVTIYSYRDNLNPGDETFEFEFEPFLTIDAGTFSSGEFQFDSGQNKLSAFLHDQFSEGKSVLCDGLPLNFNIDPDKFFLTFSENATFDGTNNFNIVVVGPVGVRFKLALADSSENLMVALQPDNEITDGESDFATIFDNGTIVLLQNYQIVDNSIEITNSIVNSFTAVQEELANAIQNYYELEQISIEQNIENNTLEANLEAQIALTNEAIANLDQTQANLDAANDIILGLEGDISDLQQGNDILSDENTELFEDIQNLNIGLQELNTAVANLSTDTVPTVQGSLTFDTLAADVILLITQVNQLQTSQQSFIDDFNNTFEQELLDAGLPLATDFINIITFTEDIISNVTNILNQQTADVVAGYQEEIANINATHDQAIQDLQDASAQDLADAEDLYVINLNTQEEYYLALIGSAETGEGLEGEIADLEAQAALDQQAIAGLNANVNALESEVNDLIDQLNELRISDLIVTSTLQNYNTLYTSINGSYSNTLTIYNNLNIDNALIYEFPPNAGDFLLYEGLFTDGYDTNILSSFDASGNIVNPSGYEVAGALILPLSSTNYTAVRLPYSSFTNQGAWQHGNEITIRLQFLPQDVGTGSGASSLPNNLDVIITNMWDDNDEWDTSGDYGFEALHTVVANSGYIPSVFETVFTVNDSNETGFLDRWANITILIPPLTGSNQINDFQLKLTHVRLGNDSQELISFNLNNAVSEAESNYLTRYNISNNHVLNWQSSGITSLEEYMTALLLLFPGSNQNYNYILTMVIPGFENPNYNPALTISEALQAFANAVFSFCDSVQQQIYNQYISYFEASNANPEDLVALQEEHAAEIAALNADVAAAEAEVDLLQAEIEYIQDNSGTFLTGPNIAATLVTLVNSDTSVLISDMLSTPLYSNGFNCGIFYQLDGVITKVDEFEFLSGSEVQALAYQPHSDTNNLVYYLTNRFQNGQTIEYQLPSSYGYPTQKLIVLFANFDENTSVVGENLPFLGVVAGIDISILPWNQFVTNPDELYQHRDLQMIFYFDDSLGDNVNTTEEVRFMEVREGLFGAGIIYATNTLFFAKATYTTTSY